MRTVFIKVFIFSHKINQKCKHNSEKKFICNGTRACCFNVALRKKQASYMACKKSADFAIYISDRKLFQLVSCLLSVLTITLSLLIAIMVWLLQKALRPMLAWPNCMQKLPFAQVVKVVLCTFSQKSTVSLAATVLWA